MSVAVENILITTDFSEVSGAAFPFAQELAKKFSARLTILHVLEEDFMAGFPMLVGYAQPEMVDVGQYREEARKRATESLQKLVADFRKAKLEAQFLLRGGSKPYVEIVRVGRELPADLIVMATHGRSGLRHALVGSTAERVVRKAACPVLTIKPEGMEFDAP